MFSLDGRIAIVTGGASGIGRGISEVLSHAGAHVVIADIDVQSGKATARDIGGTFVPLDVTSQEQCRSVVAMVVEQFGHLDVLSSNSGIVPQASLEGMTEQQWGQLQDVNLRGTFFMVQATLRPMRERGYGRIIITSSTTGSITGLPGWSYDGASEAGQQGFMGSAAIECARDGVTINAVQPRNVLTPRDVGHAACFLATEEARFITGQTLVVDGGQLPPEGFGALSPDTLVGKADSGQRVEQVQRNRIEDTGEVPEKQLFRWKDDGGAIHPDA